MIDHPRKTPFHSKQTGPSPTMGDQEADFYQKKPMPKLRMDVREPGPVPDLPNVKDSELQEYQLNALEISCPCVRIRDPTRPRDEELQRPSELLSRGQIVAFPTETVYGLGASAYDNEGCKRIFQAKGRPADNPLIVHVSSLEMFQELVPKNVVRGLPESSRKFLDPLISTFWPGPLTLIVPKHPRICETVTAGRATMGVRMPSHPVAQSLIGLSGVPVAAPSANVSGKPSPTEVDHVCADFGLSPTGFGQPRPTSHSNSTPGALIAAIVDGGPCKIGLESTVLDLTRGVPLVLRPGGVTLQQLRAVVPTVQTFEEAQDLDSTASKELREKPPTPGLKYKHYAPHARLILYRAAPRVTSTPPYHHRGGQTGLNCTHPPDPTHSAAGSSSLVSRIAARLMPRLRGCLKDGKKRRRLAMPCGNGEIASGSSVPVPPSVVGLIRTSPELEIPSDISGSCVWVSPPSEACRADQHAVCYVWDLFYDSDFSLHHDPMLIGDDAARGLYRALRALDQRCCSTIFVEAALGTGQAHGGSADSGLTLQSGPGHTVMNRLTKAATEVEIF